MSYSDTQEKINNLAGGQAAEVSGRSVTKNSASD